MSGFKLLAIRPLFKCDTSFSKKLKKGQLYKFYQDFHFFDEKKKEINKNNNNLSSKIYYVDIPKSYTDLYKANNLEINISAIVGKNGSGKSSLFELFFATIFIEATRQGLLKIHEQIKDCESKISIIETDIKIKESNLNAIDYKTEFDRLKTELIGIEALRDELNQLYYFRSTLEDSEQFSRNNEVLVEIYFQMDNKVFLLTTDKAERKNLKESNIELFKLSEENLSNFFYTISLNYSLYGLNSKDIGLWIERLFHKNDGYQTPVVINPMRTKGEININTENYLAQNRILTNLVDNKLKQRQIIAGKIIDEIQFSLPTKKLVDCDYYFTYQPKFNFKKPAEKVLQFVKIEEGKNDLFDSHVQEDILKFFGLSKLSITKSGIDPLLIEKYLSQKIFKIARTYTDYRRYYNRHDSKTEIITDISGFISKLIQDDTHKTLKIRQLVNVLKYGILSDRTSSVLKSTFNVTRKEGITWHEGKLVVKFSDYAKIINYAFEKAKEENLEKDLSWLEFVPNAFFEPEVRFRGESSFQSLSSGEQQYFNAINTIVYHILNLDSIPYHYSRINILFDEVELYFHPEFQRRFISDLRKSLMNLNLDKIKEVHILFSTHSPFILSDIPSKNILRLKEGESITNSKQTFAANIYDLLHDDFFLEDGVIGEFASEKITEVLKGNNSNEEYCLNIIELIGDPLLKSVVAEKFNSRIKDEKVLEEQINKMQEQLNKMRNAPDKGI